MKKIIFIKDNKHGSSQVINSFQNDKRIIDHYTTINLSSNIPEFFIFLKLFIGKFIAKNILALLLHKKLYSQDILKKYDDVAYIISSGGRTIFLSYLFYKAMPNVKIIYFHTPRFFRSYFYKIFSPMHDGLLAGGNIIHYHGSLHNIKQNNLNNKKNDMLISFGGDTKFTLFKKYNINNIVKLINHLYKNAKNGQKIYISFSRRTPINFIRKLLHSLFQMNIDANNSKLYFIPLPFDEKKGEKKGEKKTDTSKLSIKKMIEDNFRFTTKKYKEIINECNYYFISNDSITMLSEVASLGATNYLFPIFAIRKKHQNFVDFLVSNNHFRKINFMNLAEIEKYQANILDENKRISDLIFEKKFIEI